MSQLISSKSDLSRFFKPCSVAVIGATQNRGKVGYTVLRNLASNGFQGRLFAINPKYSNVDSIDCHPDVQSIGEPIELAIVCTPARTVKGILEQCGEAGVPAVLILTAGFGETGEQGILKQHDIKELLQKYPATRVIGPNCVGLLDTNSNLNASFARGMPEPGRISFVSQSGALCTSILDWAIQERIGFANFVSIGNMIDVGWGEIIDYLADEPNTDALVLYMESVQDADSFLEAAHRCNLKKPVVVLKAGRFKESADAAASHTGALASEDIVYDAAFRRIGVQRVNSIEELFDTAELLSRFESDVGGSLAIVSNAGGPAVMATDALIEQGGKLARLSESTIEKLNKCLPPNWSGQNPVDVIGDAPPSRLASATQAVIEDENVGAIFVIVSPQAMTEPANCAEALIEIAEQTNKPILTSWMGGSAMKEANELLNVAGLPTFSTPERAVKAYQHLIRRQKFADTRTFWKPKTSEVSHKAVSGLVTEAGAKKLLKSYGIDSVPTELVDSSEAAIEAANMFGFPVVVKIASPEIVHKSDIGGVKLNLQSEDEVAQAYLDVIAAAHKHCPQEIVMGACVQPMFDITDGYELIAGIKRDAVFGSVVMIGAGGINAEIFRDFVFELTPINQAIANSMLRKLRSWPILNGYRGQPVLNTGLVVDVLVHLSELSDDHSEIKELDINPLLVTKNQAIALDAGLILNTRSHF